MEIKQSLKTVLKRLRLSGLLATLPERAEYARKAKLPPEDFLELALSDEVERREQKNLELRLHRAQFPEDKSFEDFEWNVPVNFDRERVRDLLGLGFIERKEDVVFMGKVGVGKTMLAASLGHAACRAGKKVLFLRADAMLKELHQSRADNSTDRVLRKFIGPDLLIVDDFGLRSLDHTQSSDMYEVIIERHRRSSTIFTSNRDIDEWVPLFADPVLAQSALDRLAHNAHQINMDGETYRGTHGVGAKAAKPRKRAAHA
jgi:DNA replication protein DnaC